MITVEGVRALLSPFGELQAQDASAWEGPFPLPEPLAAFYREVGPVSLDIDGYGNGFHLPALSALWDHQAGYRWNGRTKEPECGWDDDWLVVADQGGDPFVTSCASGTVLFAQHGTGRWNFREVFPDVPTMAAGLGTLGRIVREAGPDLTDDDALIKPTHRGALECRIAPMLVHGITAPEFLEALGW